MTKERQIKDIVDSAVGVLKGGGTLLYPTDTIWGVGCDATNADAVEKIYSLKQRDHSKSMLILCEDLGMVEHYVGRVGKEVASLLLTGSMYDDASILQCHERPTTVIMPMTSGLLAGNLVAADGTIGVRIPRMVFCQALLHLLGKPLVSTSANLSGKPSPKNFGDIDEELIRRVDFCVPASMEQTTDGTGSRIVKVVDDPASPGTAGNIVVIRP